MREEKKRLRIIMGVKRLIREKVMNESGVWREGKYFKKKLVRNTWVRDEKLAKRADVQKDEWKWRRERPKLRWGITLKVTYKEWERNGKIIDRKKTLLTANVVREM